MEIDQGTAHRILVTRMLEKSFPPSRRRRGRHCRRHQHFMHGQHGFPAQNANGANWLARFQKHGLAADEMTLQDCKEGDRVRIVSVSGWGGLSRAGCWRWVSSRARIVEVKKYAPLFDPIEFIIKGSHVSLRRSEAAPRARGTPGRKRKLRDFYERAETHICSGRKSQRRKNNPINAMTGSRQHVGNWPGVTVEKKEGHFSHGDYEIAVVDLPGAYSLSAFFHEELITRNYLINNTPGRGDPSRRLLESRKKSLLDDAAHGTGSAAGAGDEYV